MSKNILPDIAKLLGVEINEEFGVRVTEQPIIQGGFDVCITEHNIVYRNKRDVNGIWQPLESDTIYDLFNGSLEIVRKPYKPKLRDKYWSYSGQAFNVVCFNWSDMAEENALLEAGMVFRTKEEAENTRPAIYERMTGKKWEDKK